VPTFHNKSEVNDPLVKSKRYEVLRPKWDWKFRWKNSETLFEHALQVTGNNYLAHLTRLSFVRYVWT